MTWGDLLAAVDRATGHPIARVLLAILAIAGVVTALKARRSRRLAYCVSGVNLAAPDTSKHPELTLLYQGEPVPRVTVSDVVVWNQGNETISRNEIAPLDPLRLEVPEAEAILSCRVVKSSRKAIGSEVGTPADNPRSAAVVFDFLDPMDWLTIQVVHTARVARAVTLKGTVKGVRKIRTGILNERPLTLRQACSLGVSIVLLFALMGFAANAHRGWSWPMLLAVVAVTSVVAGFASFLLAMLPSRVPALTRNYPPRDAWMDSA